MRACVPVRVCVCACIRVCVVDGQQVPLAELVKEAELRVIFSVSSAIRGLHQEFLGQLKERLEKPLQEKGYYTLQGADGGGAV